MVLRAGDDGFEPTFRSVPRTLLPDPYLRSFLACPSASALAARLTRRAHRLIPHSSTGTPVSLQTAETSAFYSSVIRQSDWQARFVRRYLELLSACP
jgi:hypothetical protein